MKKLIIIALCVNVMEAIAQFPAPANFKFSYVYIMLGESGHCCGKSALGPAYCSDFNWNVPDTASTDATLEFYKLYVNDKVYDTVYTETLEVPEGFMGSFYVTAVYSEPSGESVPSNIEINNDLPISVKNFKTDVKTRIRYNVATSQLIISNSEEIRKVRILDMYGKLVKETNINSGIIDLQHLAYGVYLIELNIADGKKEIKSILIAK